MVSLNPFKSLIKMHKRICTHLHDTNILQKKIHETTASSCPYIFREDHFTLKSMTVVFPGKMETTRKRSIDALCQQKECLQNGSVTTAALMNDCANVS